MIEAPFYIGLWMLAGFGIYWRLSQKEIKVHRMPAAPELLLIHHLYYKYVAFNKLFKKETLKIEAYIWIWTMLVEYANEVSGNRIDKGNHTPSFQEIANMATRTLLVLFPDLKNPEEVLAYRLFYYNIPNSYHRVPMKLLHRCLSAQVSGENHTYAGKDKLHLEQLERAYIKDSLDLAPKITAWIHHVCRNIDFDLIFSLISSVAKPAQKS